jgi:hypothetical protein
VLDAKRVHVDEVQPITLGQTPGVFQLARAVVGGKFGRFARKRCDRIRGV